MSTVWVTAEEREDAGGSHFPVPPLPSSIVTERLKHFSPNVVHIMTYKVRSKTCMLNERKKSKNVFSNLQLSCLC